MDGSESSCKVALQNPLILREIFTNLPTNLLLSSCSLVNKSWNREARTFIRDYRKCTINNADEKTCQRLHELDQLCGQMTDAGRIFPFNSYTLVNSYDKGNCRRDRARNGVVYENLTAHFQLKYFQDDCSDYKPRCPAHKQLLAWLRGDKSSQLKCLSISGIGLLKQVPDRGHFPEFNRLETIVIPSNCVKRQESDAKAVVAKFLENAIHVKRIVVGETSGLKIIPEDKYELVNKFRFEYSSRSKWEDTVFSKMLQSNLKPAELQVFVPRERNAHTGGTADFHKDLRERSDKMLGQVLRACHQSLRTLSVTGVYPIGHLPLLPMTNLSKFAMSNYNSADSPNFEEFWGAIQSIDYGETMPKLEEIEIYDHSGTLNYKFRCMQEGFEKNEWPVSNAHNLSGVPSSCLSARKVKLDLSDKRINWIPLRCFAPNIVSLELEVGKTWETGADIAPFSKMWELWPQLELLKVKGSANYLERNYDADFCGIHEQEAVWLQEMGEEFLEAVHIVPIRQWCQTGAPGAKSGPSGSGNWPPQDSVI